MHVDVAKVVGAVDERLEHDFVVFEVEGGRWLLVQVCAADHWQYILAVPSASSSLHDVFRRRSPMVCDSDADLA
jgi:hypothetical protein